MPENDENKPYFEVKPKWLFKALLLKLAVLLIVPVVFYFYTFNAVYSAGVLGIVLFFAGLKVLLGTASYRIYPDYIEFNEGSSNYHNYRFSLSRVYKIIPSHNFLQPEDIGNITIKVGKEIKPKLSLGMAMIGARQEKSLDNCPARTVVMVNIPAYKQVADKIVQLIENEEKRKEEAAASSASAVAPALKGVSNVDELLPWGLKANNEKGGR